MGLINFIATLSHPGALTPDPPDPPQPPVSVGDIVAFSLSLSNNFVDVFFDRGVYSEGLVALTTSDFEISDFVAGGVTVVSIASVKKPDHHTSASATNLAGGESVIRFFLTLTGTPDMTESFRIKPVADSVYDVDGNIMAVTKSTGTINLNINPFILWDAEESTTITTTGAGISALTDIMGNVSLAQTTDADRPLHYLKGVQLDSANTEFMTSAANATLQKQQANDFAVVIKDLYGNNNANASGGWLLAYFHATNSQGWAVRQGFSTNRLNILMMDGTTANQADFQNFEDQRGNFILQNEGGVLSIYDENNNRVGSQGSTSISTITWTAISVHMGRRQGQTGTSFNGEWRKMAFFNHAFSSAERVNIFKNINRVTSGKTGTLTKYLYPILNGSTNSSAKDTMQCFLGDVVLRSGTYHMFYTGNAADGDVDRIFKATLTGTLTPFTPFTKVLDAGLPKVILGPSEVNGTYDESEVFVRTVFFDVAANEWKMYFTANQIGGSPAYTIGLATSSDGETFTKQGQVYTDGTKDIITIAVCQVSANDFRAIVSTSVSGGATALFNFDYLTSTDGESWTKVGSVNSLFPDVVLIMNIVLIDSVFYVLGTMGSKDSEPSKTNQIVAFKTTDFTSAVYLGLLLSKDEPSERSVAFPVVIRNSNRIELFYTAFKNQNKTSANGGEGFTAIRLAILNTLTLQQPNVSVSYPSWVKFYWPLNTESATGNVFSEQIAGGTCTYGGVMQWTIDGLNLFDFLGTGATFSAIDIASYTDDLCFKMRVEIVTSGTITLFTIGTDIVVQLVSGNLRVALNNATKDYITNADIAKPSGITDPGNHVYVGFIWQGGVLKLCVGNTVDIASTKTVDNAMTDIANSGTTPVICSGATIEAGRVWIGSGQTDQQWIDTDL